MNMVEVSKKEMMEVDGGRGRSKPNTRHRRSGGYSRVTTKARGQHKATASLAVHVGVGAKTGGLPGAVGGAALWAFRNW